MVAFWYGCFRSCDGMLQADARHTLNTHAHARTHTHTHTQHLRPEHDVPCREFIEGAVGVDSVEEE